MTFPFLRPFRRVIPPIGGTLDLSPLILIVILQLDPDPAGALARAVVARAAAVSVPWLRELDDAIELRLHVQPGAKRTEVAGVHGDALKVRLAAPPVEGRANEALLRFLAESFGVALQQVTLLRGLASRHKVVRIERPRARPAHFWAGG